MKILAIETSCDETAISLLDISGDLAEPEVEVLANNLISQINIHAQYGGVYPMLAKREHQKNLPILLEKTMQDAGFSPDNPDIDCIAVTQGPGLEPALWTGIVFAEELGSKWQKPVVPINHMEGHIYSVLFENNERLKFPALALLVSGGHTEIVKINDFGEYEILGKTRDDAVGEAFDKVARMLGLPYPGGPEVSKLAKSSRGKESPINFPIPMLHSGNLDFSFSGLKTAVLYYLKGKELTDELKQDVARAFEDAAIEALISKTRDALDKYPAEVLIVAGGVSLNTHLHRELERLLEEFPETRLALPQNSLNTDNALMIGIAAYIRVSADKEILDRKGDIKALGNMPVSSWVH